jgi:SAM-dependent methyltransferase
MAAEPENPLPPEYFRRADETDDALFYTIPRLVTHIDEAACEALTRYYAELLPPDGGILDLMSSCVSHLPEDNAYRSVVGLGMNKTELDANPQLTDHVVHDLNREPALPFGDEDFDACLVAVSIQYLVKPKEVFADIARVLKPGAPCVVSYSNRMFPTKAVAVWRGLDDAQHAQLIDMYFQLSERFDKSEPIDLSPAPSASDPLYAVAARHVAA